MGQVKYFYQAEVDAGVELLDLEKPGWALDVNLDQLGMASVRNCLLGQVFGSYREGTERLRINLTRTSQRYGFKISTLSARWIGFITWPVLTAAWKTVIEERQRAQAVA